MSILHVIECYAIRQKSTGNFLPQAHAHRAFRGGYTRDEPMPASERLPRLFSLRHHAKSALDWWVQGVTKEIWCPTYPEGEAEPGLVTKPVEGRDATDMEIVLVRLEVIGEENSAKE